MNEAAVPPGTKKLIDGQWRVFYEGYWVKAYAVPADTLTAKKRLIEALTRRLFNHVEHGVNIPGTRLDEARRAFDSEADPQRKRVKAAMLAGSLFNRATDLFTKIVDIQALGIEIHADNELMVQCGEYLQQALALGKMVLHRSGEEGIDELWGEPFKAFAFPIEAFYNSRYLKIAQTMRAVDQIGAELIAALAPLPAFAPVTPLVDDLVHCAKVKCETLQTDAEIFDVWTSFVVATERLSGFVPSGMDEASVSERERFGKALVLVRACRELVTDITRARVPMPKSTRDLIARLHAFRGTLTPRADAPTPLHMGAASAPNTISS